MGVTRHKIVRVGKDDAYYSTRKLLIGQTGIASKPIGIRQGGYIACSFTFDNPAVFNLVYPTADIERTKYKTSFYRVMLKKLKED